MLHSRKINMKRPELPVNYEEVDLISESQRREIWSYIFQSDLNQDDESGHSQQGFVLGAASLPAHRQCTCWVHGLKRTLKTLVKPHPNRFTIFAFNTANTSSRLQLKPLELEHRDKQHSPVSILLSLFVKLIAQSSFSNKPLGFRATQSCQSSMRMPSKPAARGVTNTQRCCFN